MNIEDLGKRFIALANNPILSRVEHEEVRNLMRQLKEEGMSNDEISRLSKGKWTASTVKGYTKGVKSCASNDWQDAVSMLENLICSNMTLDDVETAITLHGDLKEQGIAVEQVADLLRVADLSSIEPSTLIQTQEGLKESGLSFKDLAAVLAFKDELEKQGLGLDSLDSLVELAKNLGDPQQIIESISKYSSLIELNEQIAVKEQELDRLNQQLADVHEQLDQVENKSSELKGALEAYEEVARLGFTEAQLLKLATLARKHGTVKRVLEAVEGYVDYVDMTNKVNKAKADLSSTKARIDKLEAEHAHLKTAITMCQTLLQQYKFGLDAMATILSVAKKYGGAVDVLKGLEAYGKLEALQQELGNLEGGVAGRKKLLAELEGKYHEELEGMESLHATALKVGAEVSEVQRELVRSKELDNVVSLITNPTSAGYNEYGRLVCVIAASLYKWVISNEHKFRSTYSIKDGLGRLVSELRGD